MVFAIYQSSNYFWDICNHVNVLLYPYHKLSTLLCAWCLATKLSYTEIPWLQLLIFCCCCVFVVGGYKKWMLEISFKVNLL
jgi:hypothetical protein